MPTWNARDAADWCRGRWKTDNPPAIRNVSTDTRSLEPGSLFIALLGPSYDGHDFVRQAFERGAAAALVDRLHTDALDGLGPLLAADDTRRALADLAAGHRDSLSTRFFAVTGSVGKTTVKEMIADILGAAAPTSRTRGNWNNDIGLPLSLLAVEPETRFGVFELGMNHPGELAPLCRLLKPEWSVITTIGPVHLEFFESVKAIAEEKASVFRALPAHGTAVVSRDEEWFEALSSAAPGRVLTTSLGADADYVGRLVEPENGRFTVEERSTGQSSEFRLPIPGEHVIRNALLAIAVGRGQGLPWSLMAEALKRYSPPPMRWSRENLDGVDWINDAYNANPVSMRAALKTFSALSCGGAKWVVLAGMRELGAASSEEHVALGREAARGAWEGLVVVGSLGAGIADGAAAAGFPAKRLIRAPDCAAAAAALRERVQPGDAVLMKASRGEHLENLLKEWRASGAFPAGPEANPKS